MTTDARQGSCPNCGSPNYTLVACTATVVGSIEYINNVYQCQDCGVCPPNNKRAGADLFQLPLGLPILQVTQLEIMHHD